MEAILGVIVGFVGFGIVWFFLLKPKKDELPTDELKIKEEELKKSQIDLARREEEIKAAVEAAVFFGILTSPDRPLRIVAFCITAEEFLNTSMKSPALKSWPIRLESSDAFMSRWPQLANTSGGSKTPCAVLPYS